jgi:hypothetical protein
MFSLNLAIRFTSSLFPTLRMSPFVFAPRLFLKPLLRDTLQSKWHFLVVAASYTCVCALRYSSVLAVQDVLLTDAQLLLLNNCMTKRNLKMLRGKKLRTRRVKARGNKYSANNARKQIFIYKSMKFLSIMSVNCHKYLRNSNGKLLKCDQGRILIQIKKIYLYNKFNFTYLRIVIINAT